MPGCAGVNKRGRDPMIFSSVRGSGIERGSVEDSGIVVQHVVSKDPCQNLGQKLIFDAGSITGLGQLI